MIVMDTILVVNAGSSSVKFQVFRADGERKLERLIKGRWMVSARVRGCVRSLPTRSP